MKMKPHSKTSLSGLAGVVLLAFSANLAARADFSYTVMRLSRGASNTNSVRAKTYLKGKKMKVDYGKAATIMDFEAGTFTEINHKQRLYRVTSLRDVGAGAKSGSNLEVDVKKTGHSRKIHGYNAAEVIITLTIDVPDAGRSGAKAQMGAHIWLSSDVPGAQELQAFYARNAGQFPWAPPEATPTQKLMAVIQKKTAEMQGVPMLETIEMKNAPAPLETERTVPDRAPNAVGAGRFGGLSTLGTLEHLDATSKETEERVETSDFSTAPIPDSLFAIPAGYHRSGQ